VSATSQLAEVEGPVVSRSVREKAKLLRGVLRRKASLPPSSAWSMRRDELTALKVAIEQFKVRPPISRG
jgi:hypothetical protein